MKQGSLFVTTARGGIHDEAALAAALRSGQLAGAGIDVWDQEPPPLDHPLLQMDNVYATFHTAGVTHEARRNMAVIAIDKGEGDLHSDVMQAFTVTRQRHAGVRALLGTM